MVKDLFKTSGLYFIGSVISKIVITIAWIGLARVISPEKYGQFTLYFMILQIVTFIGDFGLNQWYLTNVNQNNKNYTFSKIIYIRTLTLIFTIISLALILFIFKIFDFLNSVILLMSLIPMAYLSIAEGYFLEQKKSFRVSINRASIGALFLICYILINQNLDLQKALIAFLVSLVLTLSWFLPWKEIKFDKLVPLSEVKTILKNSSSYLYLTLTSFFYNRGDSFLIAYFRGNSALGIYGLAYRFLESLALFSTSITQNLFPHSAKKEGIKLIELLKITLVMFLAGIIIALAVFLSSDFLIVGLFGLQYSQAIPILRIFSLVLLLFFVNAPLATVVQSSKLVSQFLPYGIINTLVNLILNILLIPKFGIIAAAWIMIITELTGLIINLFFTKRLYANSQHE